MPPTLLLRSAPSHIQPADNTQAKLPATGPHLQGLFAQQGRQNLLVLLQLAAVSEQSYAPDAPAAVSRLP